MNSNVYLCTQATQVRYVQTDNPAVLTRFILDGWRVHSPDSRAHACTIDPRTDGPYWTYETLQIER